MSKTTAKQTKKNRDARGRFVKGNKASKGRPKGSKDKIPRTAKENIEETFQKLGGVKGLIEWANKSNHNKEKVYDWYFSMLPKNVDAKLQAEIRHKLSIEDMVKSLKGYKKNAD